MPVQLVVLSTCDSAIGKTIGSEGAASAWHARFSTPAHRECSPVCGRLITAPRRALMELFYRHSSSSTSRRRQRYARRNAGWLKTHAGGRRITGAGFGGCRVTGSGRTPRLIAAASTCSEGTRNGSANMADPAAFESLLQRLQADDPSPEQA